MSLDLIVPREATSADEMTDVGPGSTVIGLDDDELATLRLVGGHWGRAVGPRQAWVGALPVDPGLHRFPDSPEPGRGGRFAAVDFAETEDAGEIVATTHAGRSSWPSGRRIGCEPCRISTLERRDWRSVSLIC